MAKKQQIIPPTVPTSGKSSNHPMEDHSGRCALDVLLRKNGFAIVSRPKHSEPIWSKLGKHIPQSRAVCSLDKSDVADAKYADFLNGADYE